MGPTPRIELPLWGNVILAALAGAALLWCAIDLWRSRNRKR